MAIRERYQDNPILVVFEHYVLAVLGELPDSGAKAMKDVVQQLWGGGADWMSTLRSELALDAAFDAQIHENWAGYQANARKHKKTGSAAEFARMFADAVTAAR